MTSDREIGNAADRNNSGGNGNCGLRRRRRCAGPSARLSDAQQQRQDRLPLLRPAIRPEGRRQTGSRPLMIADKRGTSYPKFSPRRLHGALALSIVASRPLLLLRLFGESWGPSLRRALL